MLQKKIKKIKSLFQKVLKKSKKILTFTTTGMNLEDIFGCTVSLWLHVGLL